MAELTDGTAELRVLVTTALGALPLENAIVSVSTAPDDTGMRTLLYSVTTDTGGMTPSVILTTPPRSNSLSAGSGPPFAVYTVEISAEGYTPLTRRLTTRRRRHDAVHDTPDTRRRAQRSLSLSPFYSAGSSNSRSGSGPPFAERSKSPPRATRR